MNEYHCGRWYSGDIAQDKNTGKLYRVIGFITSPAVCFGEIDGEERFVEVAGCRNELSRLIRYGKDKDVQP